MITSISPKLLFKTAPICYFYPEQKKCPTCNEPLKVYKTKNRTIATLAIGECKVHETLLHCAKCREIYQSKALKNIVPEQGKFGFDVIVYIGKLLFMKNINDADIKKELKQRNIEISVREIGHLGKKFIIYLALAHKESQADIKNYMDKKGGYVLHLDGTCEGGSPHLMSSIDELSKLVIDNIKIPSENTKYIKPYLAGIKKAYGDPIAIIHDMSSAIINAVSTVFPNVLDFICHYHFLRDIGKDLFDRQYQMLARYLKECGARSKLNVIARSFKHLIDENHELKQCLNQYLKSDDIKKPNVHLYSEIKIYLLVTWALEANSLSSGYGFPFDRPLLDFYHRVKMVYAELKLLQHKTTLLGKKISLTAISKMLNNSSIAQLVKLIEERMGFFDKLREAMRIALVDGSNGLNDEGDEDIDLIKTNVHTFRYSDEVKQFASKNLCYRKMVKQIDKYWEKLFCDPIKVTTSSGDSFIQPQRTNNTMERFFRGEKHSWRKKGGTKKLGRRLQAMLADTPLVRNLNNPEYVDIILNGADTLEARFAEIDIEYVREMLQHKCDCERKYPKRMANIFKLSDLPKILSRQPRKLPPLLESNGFLP